MRTTVDLPDDLHRAASSLARDRRQSLSRTIADLVRTGLAPGRADTEPGTDPATGLPVVWVGHPVTTEMARAAADEE